MLVSSRLRDGCVEKLIPSARRGSRRLMSPMKNRSKNGAFAWMRAGEQVKAEGVAARHRPVERALGTVLT